MATYTSNLDLKKPAQSDKIRIADFNGNADNIDAAVGADFGQGTKPSINDAINSLADGLAIVAQGDVHAAISVGQFVYVRNHGTLAEGLYVASTAISANGALSGSNLTADSSGGLNSLNGYLFPIYKGQTTGTTDANGNLKLTNATTMSSVIFAWDATHLCIPFFYGSDWYVRVQITDSAGTAYANQQVTVYFHYIRRNINE